MWWRIFKCEILHVAVLNREKEEVTPTRKIRNAWETLSKLVLLKFMYEMQASSWTSLFQFLKHYIAYKWIVDSNLKTKINENKVFQQSKCLHERWKSVVSTRRCVAGVALLATPLRKW